MQRKCAFLTMADPGGYVIGDYLAIPPLKELGWEVAEIPWTQPGVDWSEFQAVVIRSTWDYYRSPREFLQVLEQIDDSSALLLNPLSVCRWNLDKTYLRDLQSRGVPIVPTRWLASLTPEDLDFTASQTVIAKPTVGANAENAFVLRRNDPRSWHPALQWFADKPVMLQPFVNSIGSLGEASLFYFAGQYSHAIVKRPSPGDFRVQEEHGGAIRRFDPDTTLLELGMKAIQAAGEPLLYARVDIVWLDDETPGVMELELIEPSLYFGFDPKAPQRFAQALNRMAVSRASE